MQPFAFLPMLIVSAMAATDVISARVYSAENYKGSYGNILGFGCSNVDKVGFKVKSIHLRKDTFCYAYPKVNCKGSSIYFTRDVPDLDTHLTTESVHCYDNSN